MAKTRRKYTADARMVDILGTAMEVLATCIVRDRSRNAVWIFGEATVVKVVEDAVRRYREHRGTNQ